MNYLKIYNDLMLSRQSLREPKKTIGFELHHIIPKCLGGTDNDENLVLLTFKEHYVAHHLLTKIHSNEPKIHYAFLCMMRDPHGNRILTARMIQTIKDNFSSFRSWYLKVNNPMFTVQARQKISKRMKENNPNLGGEWNHTAYPVKIHFLDGTSKTYSYMKLAAESLSIPYSSMKVANRKGHGMKKYNVKKIEKVKEI